MPDNTVLACVFYKYFGQFNVIQCYSALMSIGGNKKKKAKIKTVQKCKHES